MAVHQTKSMITNNVTACSTTSQKHVVEQVVIEHPETEMSKTNRQQHDNDVEQALALNKKMVNKYQSQFPEIPTMTSKELIERWKQQDREDDERDNFVIASNNSNDSDGSSSSSYYSCDSFKKTSSNFGPLLLLDVRSKAERDVSIIPGAISMDDFERTKWINKHVHNSSPKENSTSTIAPTTTAVPTIVLYCTIGYRSGREAQRLVDDLTSNDVGGGIEIGKSVDIKNLDGILAYSFVDDAPPLMSRLSQQDGGSDFVMTRHIHSYGKEWSSAMNPEYDVVYFDSNSFEFYKHLFQTGTMSALRLGQHLISELTKKAAKETTNIVHQLSDVELEKPVYFKPVYTNNKQTE
mmetsp:Transcript_4490/g.5141  ORF Transcript_4490/g.5141 Transcript_4490/m.5141 type:complete len:351 (-) Transcript_4490:296-1348(-)